MFASLMLIEILLPFNLKDCKGNDINEHFKLAIYKESIAYSSYSLICSSKDSR
jgi:hypothetical protein